MFVTLVESSYRQENETSYQQTFSEYCYLSSFASKTGSQTQRLLLPSLRAQSSPSN